MTEDNPATGITFLVTAGRLEHSLPLAFPAAMDIAEPLS
jgi:hypothetical protein